MTALDLDALAAADPELAARLRAHLDVEAAVAARDRRLDVDEHGEPLDPDGYADAMDEAREDQLTAEEDAAYEQADEAARRARRAARRAEQAEARDAAAVESWDEFWSETERAEAAERPTTVIRGVRVVIPHDLPLRFERRAEQLKGSGREEDVRELVGMVFGPEVLDAWLDNGMTLDEFQTVLLWGMARGRGRDMSFAQAREAVRTQGKSLLPNREARREFERTGGQSRPISGASTASTLPPSQR